MKQKGWPRWIGWLAAWATTATLAAAPGTGPEVGLHQLRALSETNPAAAVDAVRVHLDQAPMAAADEREWLWYLGYAAVQSDDDAAFAEAMLRLGSLGKARHDALAAPFSQLLQAKRLLRRGEHGDGIVDALRAASAIQEQEDPRANARALYELCDDYAIAEDRTRTLPACRRASAAWRALGDEYELARAEQVEGFESFNLHDNASAETLLTDARQRFERLGYAAMAGSVGDDLSRVLLADGRAAESLRLSSESLAREERDGDSRDAILSRANVARALDMLGRHRSAIAALDTSVAEARKLHGNGALADLLVTRAAIAAKSGEDKSALRDYAEAVQLLGEARTSERASAEADLEARYAQRENELRIRQLEHSAHEHELELATAQAQAAQRAALASRQRVLTLSALGASLALVLLVALLLVLWRRQRRHALELREQARHDPLTGLENRRAWTARIAVLAAQPPRPAPHQHGLLMLDLDHFKRVNDRGGHPFGDMVLQCVGQALANTVGGLGHVARLGGEEFAVVCPTLGASECLRLAELLRGTIKVLPLELNGERVPISVSIGMAMFDGNRCHDASSWMSAADQALYSAKAHGRNRVVASTAAS
jgi:diguanylate cyclase (GGDEF)-like protein